MKMRSFVGAVCLLVFSGATQAEPLATFGYLEYVRTGVDNMLLRAKLDTGADTSSLGYRHIEHIRNADGNWVMVTIANSKGESFSTLRKVVRVATIRRHGAPSVDRPVILVDLCLGGIRKKTEMTLTDRSKFSTPVLIGRSYLAGAAIVDSSRKYTTKPNCK